MPCVGDVRVVRVVRVVCSRWKCDDIRAIRHTICGVATHTQGASETAHVSCACHAAHDTGRLLDATLDVSMSGVLQCGMVCCAVLWHAVE